MNMIQNIKLIRDIETDWQPNNIVFIKSLNLIGNSLNIDFLSQNRKGKDDWPNMSTDFLEIRFLFTEVSKLKIDFSNMPYQSILGFDIQDLSINALENINFKIIDYEDGVMDFFCKDIIVEKSFHIKFPFDSQF